MTENTPTSNEVAPPSTRVPDQSEFSDQSTAQFQMSAEGQALRAALDASKPTTTESGPKGELKTRALDPTELDDKPDAPAAEEQDGQAERVTPAAPITSIAPLDGISEKYQGIAEEYQADLAAIADENPSLPPGELSTLFQFIGSRAAADMAREESDASYVTGQVPGPNLAYPEGCRSRLRTTYGDMAGAIMNAAKSEYDKLPAKVKAWIDQDQGAGRRLGNHPDVVLGLALRPFAKLSVDAATKELATIRSSTAYQTGDKLSVAKASMLQLVVNRAKPAASAPAPGTRGIVYPKDGNTWGGRDAAFPTQGTDAAKALRRELNELQSKKSDLFSSDNTKRSKAVKRRAEIQKQLSGEGA